MDPATVISTPAQTGVIETDTFCTTCHYNLHGQIVTIDDRLEIPVCRCPECGTFHPAGVGVTASSLWVRRLATMLLFAWVGIVICAGLGAAGIFFALSAGSIESFAFEKVVPNATNLWRFQMQLRDWREPMTPNVNGFATMMWICGGSVCVGLMVGILGVTLLWHWQWQRYLYVVLLPLISATFLCVLYRSMANYDLVRNQCYDHVFWQTTLQCLGIVLGLLTGRTISRAVIRTVIPPKARQALAFLWTVDGKPLPA